MFVGGRRSRPLTASRYSPAFGVDARLGERRAQLRVPVEAAVDLLQPIAAVGDLVVGAEQAARNVLGSASAVAAADAVMADRELARHPLQHAVEVGARRDVRQERRVLLALLRPVHAVHVRRVEVVAVDPPRLVEDLLPLGARIDRGPRCASTAMRPSAGSIAPRRRHDRPGAAARDRAASCRRPRRRSR